VLAGSSPVASVKFSQTVNVHSAESEKAKKGVKVKEAVQAPTLF
jgi:hypothetical protein